MQEAQQMVEILQNFQNNDDQIRNNAYQSLLMAASNNPDSFVVVIMGVIQNEQIKQGVRLIAILMMQEFIRTQSFGPKLYSKMSQ